MLQLLPAPTEPQQRLLARLSRVAHRHPQAAERLLSRLAQQAADPALALDALTLRFALLEPRGRAADLLPELTAAHQRATAERRPVQAARTSEALGRIAYQQGEYQRASEHWSRALDLAELAGNPQMAVAARIGLAQIRYASGDWAQGLRLHQDAAARLVGLDDSYLAAKLALNLGVGHFELGDLPAAERQFSHGLAAARRGTHREFEAEAHWHLARTALARQQLHWAIADCRLVLDIAARHGYPWLEAAASRTWTEIALARGDRPAAIRSTRHGLELAQRIHARAQASAAHRQLAEMLQQQGDSASALDQLWQHLALQAELERLSQPTATPPGAPGPGPGHAIAPASAEGLLLQVIERRRALIDHAQPAQALAELLRVAAQALGLAGACMWTAPAAADAPWPALEAGSPPLPPGPYRALLQRQSAPLALSDAALHPCLAELAALPGAGCARIELPLLRRRAGLAGVLWLVDAGASRAWTRQDLLVAHQIALLCEAVLAGGPP